MLSVVRYLVLFLYRPRQLTTPALCLCPENMPFLFSHVTLPNLILSQASYILFKNYLFTVALSPVRARGGSYIP